MIVKKKPITKARRNLLLLGIAVIIYPLVASLYVNYGWYIIKRIWSFNKPLPVYDVGYRPHSYGFNSIWILLLAYELWSYVLFIHLPFVRVFDHYPLWQSKLKSFLVYVGLLVVIDMIFLPQSTVVSFFGQEQIGQRLTLLLIIALTIYPLYRWVLNYPIKLKNE
ncbi:hypothetical protein [Siphonobacter sp. SORGH_AS_0500]|uniref:hypothetical protein n=1 Tax=Siphonobacter sp. SORGH_AS_0500 TaxID=1864824 RepID=UPI00286211EB|nr:hypothetical protein [Siphonobacter sp. SORGH_AS_0500]MDR6197664.1 hypothetical protein [Siphonobacter sp. SORGH_AS_0500]